MTYVSKPFSYDGLFGSAAVAAKERDEAEFGAGFFAITPKLEGDLTSWRELCRAVREAKEAIAEGAIIVTCPKCGALPEKACSTIRGNHHVARLREVEDRARAAFGSRGLVIYGTNKK